MKSLAKLRRSRGMQLQSSDMKHFPIFRKEKPTDAMKQVEEIQLLQQEFNSRF